MKNDSLKRLQEAAYTLEYICNNPTEYNQVPHEYIKKDVERALADIRAAIFMETPHTSTKFDIYKYAAKDQTRPVMEGICHRGGFRTASDAHILVAIKESYDEALEGKIIGPDGCEIEGKYPNWESLFPKTREGVAYPVDTTKVYETLRQVKAERKLKKGEARQGVVKVGDACFDIELFARLCIFMDAYGTNEIYVKSRSNAASVYAPDGSKALLMPKVYASIDYADVPSYELYDNYRDRFIWCVVA